MNSPQTADARQSGLAAACAGGDLAFQELVAPHLRALHVHCYRMLGSLDDADEVMQESPLRAWRGLGGPAAGPRHHRAARTAPAAALTDRERQVLDRFVQAWHRQDIPALAALLRDDVILTMPPELEVVIGRDRVTHFLSTVPADGRLDRIRLVHTRANGQPALVSYLHEPDGAGHGYGIMVFTVVGDAVAGIVGFPGPDLYDRFDLPQVWDRPVVGGTAKGR